MADFG